MKISTVSALFLLGLCIIGLGGCSKPAKSKPAPTNNINPKTAVTVCDYDANDTTLTNHGWTKTFDDEFTGDLSNWYAYTGGEKFSGVYEQQCYEPANAQIVNGVLQLNAMQQTVTGPDTIHSTTQKSFNYTSASIVSNQTFSASSATPKVRIVARVKVASGYGLASIFESYGINWPTNGQINFLQVEGDDTKEYETDYFYGTQLNQNLVGNAMLYNPADQDLSACWHVFMTEWTQNAINYYLDGQLVESTTTGGYVPSLFGKSENIALSLPIGGLYYDNLVTANIQAGTMYVDYVKVFTSN
jgi:beta-glucanase (GH16 family)